MSSIEWENIKDYCEEVESLVDNIRSEAGDLENKYDLLVVDVDCLQAEKDDLEEEVSELNERIRDLEEQLGVNLEETHKQLDTFEDMPGKYQWDSKPVEILDMLLEMPEQKRIRFLHGEWKPREEQDII